MERVIITVKRAFMNSNRKAVTKRNRTMPLQNDIQDELKQLAPALSTLPRTHPFITPEKYFEEMEVRIVFQASRKLHVQESGLKDETKALPFAVPAGYFNDLPDQILDRIQQQPQPFKNSVVQSRMRVISKQGLWLVAASLALLIVSSFLMKNALEKQSLLQTAGATMSNVTESELMLLVSDIDEAMIVEIWQQNQAINSTNEKSKDNYTPSLVDMTEIDEQYFF